MIDARAAKTAWVMFKGGPFDNTYALWGDKGLEIIRPGACPAIDDEWAPLEYQIPVCHRDGCGCPEDWFGPQRYTISRALDGTAIATYTGPTERQTDEDELTFPR